MTQLDDKLLPALKALVEDKVGAQVTIKKKGAEEYDAGSGQTIRGAPTTFTAKATPPGDYREMFGDGSSIKASDTQIGFAGQDLAFTPELEDLITVGGLVWTVTLVKPIYSGASICFWFVNLHRGP